MAETLHNSESTSLWHCLHDGSIESLKSDLWARTLTFVVDSPFHWGFHKLPQDTRFRVVAENVRIIEVFDFEPWAGAVNPANDTPWKEAKEQRRQNYEKGRLVSTSWNNLVAQIEAAEDYEIITAELNRENTFSVLNFGILSNPKSDWHDVKVHAECFHFAIGDREVSLEEFEEFGSAYWNAFAERSKAQLSQPKAMQ